MSVTAKSTIEVQGLIKDYGSFRAVKGVSFNVHKGEIVGFLGPNGAGKSTVMKVLTCYLSATEGKVRVAGHDSYTEPLAVRRKVGYQPENVPLYGEMVVYDYLLFMAKMRGVKRSERKKRIEYVIETCGLEAVAAKLVRELSKGYRQRVGLGQALIHDPSVLILDEPMSGLDPNQITEIRDLIKDIGREKTVIFSSHILQEIEKICDRILIIDHGRIVADGTINDLTARLEGRRRYELVLANLDAAARQAAKEKLEALSARVQDVPTADSDLAIFRLTADEGSDLRGTLFALVRDENWSLRELREVALGLEDVFRALTGDDAPPAKKAKAARKKSDTAKPARKAAPAKEDKPRPEPKADKADDIEAEPTETIAADNETPEASGEAPSKHA